MRTLAVVAGIALLGPDPLPAQDWWSSWIGKATPIPTTSHACAAGKYAIGIVVKAGIWLDALRVECASLGASGEHQNVAATAWTPDENGSTAPVKQLRCASGKVLVGLRGKSGDWIDRIQAGCRNWSRSQGANGTVSWTSAAGGSTGADYGPVTCPAGGAATAFKAKTITGNIVRPPVVEAVQFGCKGP